MILKKILKRHNNDITLINIPRKNKHTPIPAQRRNS